MSDLNSTIASQGDESNTCLPIKLSSNELFCQRQSDVFSVLANLEAAHIQVTKDTKAERKAVSKAAWRHPITAPENLAERKKQRSLTNSDSDPIVHPPNDCHDQPTLENSNEFRRPTLPPPNSFRHPKNRPNRPQLKRDPNKWTHYNLSNVDEDAPSSVTVSGGFDSIPGHLDSNSSIALALIGEIRERNVTHVPNPIGNEPQPSRILFRPTRGSKRPRLDSTNPRSLPNLAMPSYISDDYPGYDEGAAMEADSSGNVESSKPVFINRRTARRGQFRNCPTDNQIESDNDVTGTNEDCFSGELSDHDDIDLELDDCNDDDDLEIDGMGDFLS